MEKKFTMTKTHLEVVVKAGDRIWLPMEDGSKVDIGTFDQTTIQKIDLDKAQTLKDFISKELDKGQGQLDGLSKQLAPLKDIKEIDDEVVDAVKKQIGKGTKVFKQKMLVLNDHIQQVARKKQITQQMEYIQKEVDRLSKEVVDINKAVK